MEELMPVTVKKLPQGKFEVRTPNMVHAKATTEAKAKAQERLLNAIDHNPNFKPHKK
jgi:predicted HicB family RNase H-like nuclease